MLEMLLTIYNCNLQLYYKLHLGIKRHAYMQYKTLLAYFAISLAIGIKFYNINQWQNKLWCIVQSLSTYCM